MSRLDTSAGQAARRRGKRAGVLVVGGQVAGGVGHGLGGLQNLDDPAHHVADGPHGDLPGRRPGTRTLLLPPSRQQPPRAMAGRKRTVVSTATVADPGTVPLPCAPCQATERTYVRPMERRYELESLRRSLAMLRPGAPALDREEAMRLVRELQDLERQLRTLREGLAAPARLRATERPNGSGDRAARRAGRSGRPGSRPPRRGSAAACSRRPGDDRRSGSG